MAISGAEIRGWCESAGNCSSLNGHLMLSLKMDVPFYQQRRFPTQPRLEEKRALLSWGKTDLKNKRCFALMQE